MIIRKHCGSSRPMRAEFYGIEHLNIAHAGRTAPQGTRLSWHRKRTTSNCGVETACFCASIDNSSGAFLRLAQEERGSAGKALTFAFCSPIVRGDRGNGKRVASTPLPSGSPEPDATR